MLSEPEQVRTLSVTQGVLEALGVPPALGRWFSREDDTPGTPETVMLTHGYWQRRFGGDRGVIGPHAHHRLAMPRAVIGVMPRGFRFLDADADADPAAAIRSGSTVPGQLQLSRDRPPQAGRDGGSRRMPTSRACCRSGSTRGRAPLGHRQAAVRERRASRRRFRPLKQDVVGNITDVLWVLMGTIGVVLLIACANVANLLLVRVEGRQQELAMRAALGAGWGRIARELLQESLLLGVIGGALGVGVAYGALRLLEALRPETLPRLDEITIDPLVLGIRAGRLAAVGRCCSGSFPS